MKKIFKGFALAVNMLSILPFFKVHDFYKGINGYSVMFYPLVGYIIGLILILSHTFLITLFPALHVSVMILAIWVLVTGALHIDGFSDSVDGLFVDKRHSFSVMKDPNVGAMGMVFTVIMLLLKASALLHVNSWLEIPIILMLARYNAVLAIYFYPYLSKNGMGALAKEEFNSFEFMLSSVLVITAVILIHKAWVLLLFSLALFFILKRFFMNRYGGFSGDIYGFIIELTELVLLHVSIVKL